MCSSSAQKEAKSSTTVLSVSFLDAPSSTPPKSWLVVARGASARLLKLQTANWSGTLGWVHQHEASLVGQPRERMMGVGRDRLGGPRGKINIFERRPASASETALGSKRLGDWQMLLRRLSPRSFLRYRALFTRRV